MAEEIVPGTVETDDNLLIVAALKSTITAAVPTAADLNKVTTKKITYSLTNTGFGHTQTQESVPDERLTLSQVLAGPGRKTHALVLQFFFGAEDDVADALFQEGEEYVIGVRYAIPNEDPIVAAQKWDFLFIKAGAKRKDAPAANGRFTKTMDSYMRGRVLEDVAIVAGP